MITRNLKPYRCELGASGPESVHRAVELVRGFCTDHSLAPAQSAKLAILVEEAVTNIYEHGQVEGPRVGWVMLGGDAAGVHICLADNCAPFDPRSFVESDQPNMERGGGAGLSMIRAWAEIVDYRQEDGFNLLELVLLG